jgi:hypothetical protein
MITAKTKMSGSLVEVFDDVFNLEMGDVVQVRYLGTDAIQCGSGIFWIFMDMLDFAVDNG